MLEVLKQIRKSIFVLLEIQLKHAIANGEKHVKWQFVSHFLLPPIFVASSGEEHGIFICISGKRWQIPHQVIKRR